MKDDRFILLLLLVMLLTGFVVLVCTGCKVRKHGYEYTGSDWAQVVDSTAGEGHTEQVAKDSVSTSGAVTGLITFADGGGMITTGGGVTLTGVQAVDGSVFGSGQVFHVEHFIHDTAFVAVHDTIHQTAVQVVEMQTESKAQNFWWVWLLVGLVVGAGGIIALKKIPYTRPLMFWL